MQQINPTIRLMTPEETRSNRLINARSVMEHKVNTIPIGAGRSDQVHVFQESVVVYVLTLNYKHGYVGLEIFDSGSGEEYDCLFLQYEWEVVDCLGIRWEEMEPLQIVKTLVSRMY